MGPRVLILLSILALSGCSIRSPSGVYGTQGAAHEQFRALDSLLRDRTDERFIIRVQDDVGQYGPVRGRPALVRFTGELIGIEAGFLTISTSARDTMQIGKGNVVAVYEYLPPSSRAPGAAIGAVILAGAMVAFLGSRPESSRPGEGGRVMLIGGSALLGAAIGWSVGGGPRQGTQVYPVPTRSRPVPEPSQ